MRIILMFITALLITTSSYAALTANNIPRTRTGGSSPSLQDSVMYTDGNNIGIGTIYPSQKLDVNGVVKATTFSGSAASMTAIPADQISGVVPIANLATGVPTGLKFIRDDGTLQVPAGGGGGSSQWTTNGTAIYYSDGNVGIGSVNPTQFLDVQGGNINTSGSITSTGTGDSYFSGQNVGIGTLATIYSQLAIKPPTSVTGLVIGSSYSITNLPGITDGALIQGNVGIGTALPSTLLEIGARKLNVTSAGNVGIGTIAPPNALYVVGTPMFTVGLNIGIGTESATRLCIANGAVTTCP